MGESLAQLMANIKEVLTSGGTLPMSDSGEVIEALDGLRVTFEYHDIGSVEELKNILEGKVGRIQVGEPTEEE